MFKISVNSNPKSQSIASQSIQAESNTTTQPFLVFKLSTHLYAVNLLQIREVRKIPAMTRVAHAPSYVVGVTSIRGEIVPVINLKERFKLDRSLCETDQDMVIISEMEGKKVGILVDSVQEVVNIDMNAVQAVPRTIMAIDMQYLLGMTQDEGQVILLVDLQKILQPDELHAVAQVTPETMAQANSHVTAYARDEAVVS
jgi:purine-binding chemotaxis protein CheW